jgi:hypothetical protein
MITVLTLGYSMYCFLIYMRQGIDICMKPTTLLDLFTHRLARFLNNHPLLKRLLLSFILILPYGATQAQSGFFVDYRRLYSRPRLSPFSLEFTGGISYYVGDIAAPGAISARGGLGNFAFGTSLAYRFTEYVSLRAGLTQFRLKGKADRPAWTGREFKSNNQELQLVIVHDLIPKENFETYQTKFNFYAFGGVALLRYIPRSIVTGEKLEPLGNNKFRENNGTFTPLSYGSFALALPVGIGFQYHFYEDMWIAIEAGYRYTTTDFLDDASYQRYFNLKNDGYYMLGFRMGIQLYSAAGLY